MSGARVASFAAAVVLSIAVIPIASAAPNATEREARHRFAEGETQYRAGHYAEALASYQAGYAADPLPGFLINIAQCQRRLGDLKTARATYREFVLVAPDSRLVPEVEQLIKELDGLVADLEAGGAGTPAQKVGEGEADPHATDPSAPSPLRLAPAPPPVDQPLLAAPAPAASEGAAPEAPPPKRSHARWWILGGAALAAVAGGVATAVALSSSSTTTIRAGTLGTLSR